MASKIGIVNGGTGFSPNAQPDPRALNYENPNLDEITLRQLDEDVVAYSHDLSFCQEQLVQEDLTPQETRTFQIRILDLNHQIRHCKHRCEILRAQMRHKRGSFWGNPNGVTLGVSTMGHAAPDSTPNSSHKRSSSVAPASRGAKSNSRKRVKTSSSPPPQDSESNVYRHRGDHDLYAEGGPPGPITNLQRLGHWHCRLCRADKYLLVEGSRVPAAPCKWPLKDVAKMIAHFTEMHTEHRPDERCVELGEALRQNRGPFEYWLRRSRSQDVGDDGGIVDECIADLLGGRLPDLLRRLSRAASGFPA